MEKKKSRQRLAAAAPSLLFSRRSCFSRRSSSLLLAWPLSRSRALLLFPRDTYLPSWKRKQKKQTGWEKNKAKIFESLIFLNLEPFFPPEKTNKQKLSIRSSMSKVPEFWGRESPYHGNTDFLGTPSDHLEVRRRGGGKNRGRNGERERERLFFSTELKKQKKKKKKKKLTQTKILLLPPLPPLTSIHQPTNNSSPPSAPSPRTSSRSTASPSTTACPSTR